MDLGRLIGSKPPLVPVGGRAFASHDPDGKWRLRYAMPGEDEAPARPRVPGDHAFFVHQSVAYDYLKWVVGEADSFAYPAGEA